MDRKEIISMLTSLANILNRHKSTTSIFNSNFKIEREATIEEVSLVEKKLATNIPIQLKNFFLEVSGDLYFNYTYDEKLMELIKEEFRGVFSSSLILSLDTIVEAEESRKDWIENCYNNPSNEYDKVYYNKFAFISVKNGDLIAFDDKERVVYISHDDDDLHGKIIANDFNSFVDNYIGICMCGPECWQLENFMQDGVLDKNCTNAIKMRTIINKLK